MAKNSNKKKLLAMMLLLGLVTLVFLDAVRHSRYEVGMSISEAQKIVDGKLRVDGDGCEESKLSTIELQSLVHFSAYDLESGEELGFNHYGKLLEIRKRKWLGINFLKLMELYEKLK